MTTLSPLSRTKENESIVRMDGHTSMVLYHPGGAAMDKAEELRQQAADCGADVIDWDFGSDRIKGMYCNGVIAISKNLKDSTEQACVLAEEIGHHLTASGNILDQHQVENRKQELKGRAWAYDRLIGLDGIVRAHDAGCQSRYEAAEYLCVSEGTLQDAIDYYHEKYGLYVKVGRHTIYFEPLGVMEMR